MGDEEGKMDRVANFSGGRKMRPVAGRVTGRKDSHFKMKDNPTYFRVEISNDPHRGGNIDEAGKRGTLVTQGTKPEQP